MSGAVTHPISEGFPSATFPTAFADGVLNATISPEVVKFYLFRFEPSFKGDNRFQTQAVGKVVMPAARFVTAALYLNLQLESLVEKGFVSRERVEELRQAVGAMK